MWCFEKSIKFISSYAYVYVFMENESFCPACAHTFGLIKDNPTQIAINKIVQLMLTLLQSCTTPLVCTFFAYYTLNFLPGNVSESSLGVLVVVAAVFLVSYLMTKAFAQVYEQVVQSLTVCVLHDMKEYGGRYTRPALRVAFELDTLPSAAKLPPPISSSTDGPTILT